jgi:hypothetical protein
MTPIPSKQRRKAVENHTEKLGTIGWLRRLHEVLLESSLDST